MASTFFGLNIANSGLRAANAAINTAANNVSNADTKGYSRQRVVQEAADPLRTFAVYGCSGAGVQTLAIERVRDAFYDVKYRENESRYGEYKAKNYYMDMLQTYFDDDGKTGFSTLYTALKAIGTQEVLKNPGDATAKKDFMGAVEKLVEYFGTSAENLEKLQKDVNDEIKVNIDKINSISKEIQTLNKQINVIELTGSKANELRDKRDLLVDELSGIVDVDISEFPVYDSNNPDRETGATRYIVRIAGGQTLVDDNRRNELECRAKVPSDRVNQSDAAGLYDIYWVEGDRFNTANSRMTGALAGLVRLRDGNNGEYFQGSVSGAAGTKTVTTTVDGVEQQKEYQTVKVNVSEGYLKDLNKATLAGTGTINIGNRLYRYDGWTFERDADGNCSYTFMLPKDADNVIVSDVDQKFACIGDNVNYKGVPYYQAQMNEWTRLFARSMNEILKSGYTDDGKPGCQLFTYDDPSGNEGFFNASHEYQDGSGDTVTSSSVDLFSGIYQTGLAYSVSSVGDSYYQLTAGNLTVFDALKANSELLGVKSEKNKTDGESQYDNMSLLLETMNEEKKLSFRGANAGEFLTCVLGDITLAAGSAQTFEDNYRALEETLKNQRLSISGVDEDEEALSVAHLQDNYTLACKLITMFTEIYDRLILETGV